MVPTTRARCLLFAWLATCGVVPGLGQAAPPADRASQAATIVVPLEVTKTRHLAIQVRVNDQGPFRMILDTGSPVSFVGTSMAKRLGLIDPKAGTGAFFGMRLGVKLKSVVLGDAVVRDQQVMVLDHPTVEMLSQVNGQLEGIIGLNILSRYRFTIDYSAGQLGLTPTEYQPRDVMADVMGLLLGRMGGKTYLAPGALWGVVVEKPDRRPGVRVAHVFADSPAEAGGLRLGDRILTVDRRWTDSVRDMYEAASLVTPGRAVPMHIERAGAPRDLLVKPVAGL